MDKYIKMTEDLRAELERKEAVIKQRLMRIETLKKLLFDEECKRHQAENKLIKMEANQEATDKHLEGVTLDLKATERILEKKVTELVISITHLNRLVPENEKVDLWEDHNLCWLSSEDGWRKSRGIRVKA